MRRVNWMFVWKIFIIQPLCYYFVIHTSIHRYVRVYVRMRVCIIKERVNIFLIFRRINTHIRVYDTYVSCRIILFGNHTHTHNIHKRQDTQSEYHNWYVFNNNTIMLFFCCMYALLSSFIPCLYLKR